MPLFALLTAPLPWPVKHRLYRARGWDVDATARVGLSYLDVRHLELGPGARVGHLTAARRLKRLTLGRDAQLGSLNDLVGPRLVAVADRVRTQDWPATLELGDEAIVFNRHFIDVSGTVVLGRRAMLAGAFTRIWSHGPHPLPDGQRGLHPATVRVGEDVYVGAGATLLPDTDIPAGCTVGAASVVTRAVARETPGTTLAGNPARAVGVRAAAAGPSGPARR